MKKIVKRTAIAISILVFICFAANIALNIILSYSLPEAELKKEIVRYFENNIGRSVKISSVRYGFFQNIEIDEIKISASNDFNDLESFLKVSEVEIKLSGLALLKGDIIVNKLILKKPHVKITKKFGKSYQESFKVIAGDKITEEFFKKIISIKRISIEDAFIEYTENFEKDNVVLIFENISADIRRSGTNLYCDVNGKMKSSADTERNDVSLESRFVLNDSDDIIFHKTSIEADNISLTDFQPYKSIWGLDLITFRGNASVEHSFSVMNGLCEIETNLKVINLFISQKKGSQIRNMLENESVTVNLRGEIGLRKSFEADFSTNSGIKLKAKFTSTGTESSRSYYALIDSDKVDLSKLSKYLTIKNPVKYGGFISFDGSIYYRCCSELPEISDLYANVEKFTISDIYEGERKNIIDEMNFKFSAESNTFELDGNYNSKSTSLGFGFCSDMKRVFPFSANSKMHLDFNKTDYSSVSNAIIIFKDYINREINDDRQIGYNQEYFRDRLFGKILLSNSFEAEINCKSLNFKGNASVKNIAIGSSLDNGIWKASLLNTEGYSAKYAFNAVGYMNADMPLIKAEIAVDNFDLSSFWKDSGIKGHIGEGIINIKSVFEIAAYRALHFSDNSKISFEADIKAESLSQTPFQSAFTSILKKDGFKPNIDLLSNFSFNYSVDFAGGNTYLKTFSIKSDYLSASGYGTFSDKGLSYPVSCSFSDDDNVSRQWKMNLLSPVCPTAFMINFQSNGRDRSVNLFHID